MINISCVLAWIINALFCSLLRLFAPLIPGNSAFKSPDEFKVSLPLRTNYLYGKVKKTLPELYAFTVCLWLRSSASPGIGTPFSYAVPGQANEIVLIEWGNNPIELLINDKVRSDELFVLSVARTGPDPLVPWPWLLPSLSERPLRCCCLLLCCPLADCKSIKALATEVKLFRYLCVETKQLDIRCAHTYVVWSYKQSWLLGFFFYETQAEFEATAL